MKTKRKLLTIIISVLTLTLSIPAFASGIVISPDSSNAKKGETFSVTVKLNESISAKTGAVEVSLPEGIKVKEGKWLVSNPTLSTYDLAKNKGAFAYSSSKDVSGELIILEFEVTSDADNDRSVGIRIEFRDGTKVLFNETESLKIAKIAGGSEAETTTAKETDDANTPSEDVVIESSADEDFSLESPENSEEKKVDNHSTNGVLSIIIVAVIILIIILVIVIVIIKKNKKTGDIQEEHHD